jgi:hypothetical protein
LPCYCEGKAAIIAPLRLDRSDRASLGGKVLDPAPDFGDRNHCIGCLAQGEIDYQGLVLSWLDPARSLRQGHEVLAAGEFSVRS